MTQYEQAITAQEGRVVGYEAAEQALSSFLDNPGLARVAKLYGATNLTTDPDMRLAALQAISGDEWDYRKNKERPDATGDPEVDVEGSEKWKAIFSAATELGMVESSKPNNIKDPAYLVVLGGMNRSAIDRMGYVLDSVDDFGQLVLLASGRLTSEEERKKIQDFAPNAGQGFTEFDANCAALEYKLGARLVHEFWQYEEADKYVTRIYEFEHKGQTKQAYVLSTPQQVNGHRATTYDNYRFFAGQFRLDKMGDLPEDQRPKVVSVTTGLYVPGQHLPAVQELMLPYGIEVETIGHSADYSKMKRKPSQLLQEMKAAIDAAIRLRFKLDDAWRRS